MHRLVGAKLHGLGGVIFEHADFGHPVGCNLATVRCGARVGTVGQGIDPGLRGRNAHLHVDQFVAHHLVLQQQLPKGLALARPAKRLVKTGLRKPERQHRHAQALAVEVTHDHLETRTLGTQAVAGRDSHIVKADVRRVRTQPAHFVQARARNARQMHRHHQHRNTGSATRTRITRAHGGGDIVCPHARGDESLFAVQEVVAAIGHGGGPDGRHVRATTGLGDRQRRYFVAPQNRWHDFLQQISRAMLDDDGQADAVRKQAGIHAATGTVPRQAQ